MKRILASALLLGTFTFVGCGEQATVEKETTIETPTGTTSVETETTVTKEGEAPPPTPDVPGGATQPADMPPPK